MRLLPKAGDSELELLVQLVNVSADHVAQGKRITLRKVVPIRKIGIQRSFVPAA